MGSETPTASVNLLVAHLLEELAKYEKQISKMALRDKILRLIELQDGFRKLGIALAVQDGLSPASARGRIRDYLQAHPNTAINGLELAAISGISEYARRVRELRSEGMPIISGADSDNKDWRLRPDQYFLNAKSKKK